METWKISRTGHGMIDSDRIVARPVFDHDGTPIGTIRCLVVDRLSGHVESVCVHSRSVLGIVSHEYLLPWSVLKYDTRLPGYRTSLRKSEIKAVESIPD